MGGCWVVQTLQNNYSQMLNFFAQKRTLVGPEGLKKDGCQPTPDLLSLAGHIPVELGNLAALKELDLANNQLSGESQ